MRKNMPTSVFVTLSSLCVLLRVCLAQARRASPTSGPPDDPAMEEAAEAAELVVIKTKGVDLGTPVLHLETRPQAALPDADGESTPKSKRREGSPIPPGAPHIRRGGHGFAPVFENVVEVNTAGGERMRFDTKDITTGDLRVAIALRRGLPSSQVQLLCGQIEVSDDTPVDSGQLSVVFRQAPGPATFPVMLR